MLRPEGAADCPDAADIARSLRGLMRREVVVTGVGGGAPPSERWSVRFRLEGGGYAATIRAEGTRRGERSLSSPGATCREVGEAAAVTIALVLDDALPLDPPSPPSAASTDAASTDAASTDAASTDAAVRQRWRVGLEARAGAGGGVVHGFGAVGALGGELSPPGGRWAFGAGGFGAAPSSFEYAPGRVTVSLAGGYVRACRTLVGAPEGVRALGCGLGAAGAVRGEGEGFPRRNRSEVRPWLAAGLAASLRGPLAARLGWSLTASGFVPLWRQGFSVVNVGTAYDPARAGGALEAGVTWTNW